MGERTGIEWCDHTFNPWIGCTKVSPGCAHCYAAELMDRRYGRVEWGAGKPRSLTSDSTWRNPLVWNKAAERAGVRRKVFCSSLADVFDSEVSDAWREGLWALIAETAGLDWLLLTKRIGNVASMVPWGADWPGNVWIGVSVENAEVAAERLPILSELPAVVRFVSAEPLLGDFSIAGFEIDWLIAGGESGHGFRAVNPDHVRSLRDQCVEHGVAFFFKQWGGLKPKSRGKVLDGREWCEFPSVGESLLAE